MELNLGDRLVVVTGGSKGIGLACARAFAAEGSRVVIVSRNADNITAARRTLEQSGFAVDGIAANLTQPEAADSAFADIESRHGPVDILINSAGAARRFDPDALDAAAYRAGMDDKYFPTMNAMDAALKQMRTRAKKSDAGSRAQTGAIVNIIGVGGKVANPIHVSGGAANAALALATVGLANHYAPLGIRINAIHPASTMTGRVQEALAVEAARSGKSPDAVLAAAQRAVPLGRYALPEEIADVALFMASERASYMVGAVVMLDGGKHALI